MFDGQRLVVPIAQTEISLEGGVELLASRTSLPRHLFTRITIAADPAEAGLSSWSRLPRVLRRSARLMASCVSGAQAIELVSARLDQIMRPTLGARARQLSFGHGFAGRGRAC